MPAKKITRLINIALRGMTLASKFLLIFFLARFLEPAELGLYGLLTATISYALYLLGFDFYTFTTREILKRDRSEWGGLLKDQGALSLLLYAIFLPMLSLVFINGYLPWHVAAWFFALLVLEHLTQELGRLLIAISEQLLASIVLFLRSGIWAVAATALMLVEPETRSLNLVLGAWTAGGIAALLLGVYRLNKLGIAGWHRKVDWKWIRKGLKVAIPLLVATLAIRGVFTLDRYWFGALAGLDILGAYVLFMGVCNALMSFLDAGVFAFIYPSLITAYHKQDSDAFRQSLRKMLIQTLLLTIVFAGTATVLIEPLLSWLNKPLYLEYQDLFPWLLLATLLYAVGMVPHFALYAQGQDRPIIHSHIASLICFIPTTWLFSAHWPYLAVPLGLCASFALILLWKTWAYVALTPIQYRLFQS
ncbi:MAG: oligosaccharide flippase family protein [Pseudomonadales bacterium]|nr:oligosaccharide flippase family protein [Pseudomonadales bacterium]MBH2078090.1 oligosaccharide flippase family protein [Pseudomonadales bacterium]